MSKWMVKMKKADFDAIAEKFGISRITARLLCWIEFQRAPG